MSSWNWFQIGRVLQDLEFSGRDFTRWDPYLVWSEFGSPRLRKRWVCAWRSGVTAGDPHVQKLARDREKEVTYFIRVYFCLDHSDWWWNTLDVWIKTRRHCSADSWVFSFFFRCFLFFCFFCFFSSCDLIEPPTASLKGKHEKRGGILSASTVALRILSCVVVGSQGTWQFILMSPSYLFKRSRYNNNTN